MALTVGPVRLADPRSPWNGQRVYLHIVPQGIERVESTSAETDVWVSPGWVDLVAWTNQPQIPTAESFSELAERANRGGFTTVGVGGWWGWHEPELLVQLRSSWELLPITFLPLASWADPRGRIAPVESLRVEGAFGWTLPPEQPIPWGTLARALPYLRHLGGPVFILPFWEGVSGERGVGEVPELSLSGWEGYPPYVETIAVHAIAALWKSTGGQIIIGPITTKEGLQEARRYGMPLFTGGAYVVADASRLLTYDPFWKVHPPLRSSLDRNSLVAAVGRGDIGVSSFDFRASSEDKLREWSSAAVGQAVIEHMPSLVWQAVRDACVGKWDPPRFASLLSEKPRRLLGLPAPVLREGHPLDLTFFRIEREPFQLPPPWEGFSSTLKVLGVIRCLDDVRNLRIQMS